MLRRDMLKLMLGASLTNNCYGSPMKQPPDLKPQYFGWIDDPVAREKFITTQKHPFLSQQNNEIKRTGEGQIVLLYKLFEQVTSKPLVSHVQGIGDCTSHAFGLGIDVLTAIRILMHNKPERWITKCATEILYAGSRVEVGESKVRGDGTTGVWMAEFVRDWGVLLRQKYLDKYDYTTYNSETARMLGETGVPDDLESLCRLHPVKTCAIVQSWEECRDAIANGYTVAMSSSLGFNKTRDKDGFLRRTRRPWYHSMVILGTDDEFKRPGALVQNSWPVSWVSGPKRHEQPEGSFWVDASTIDRAMKQGDSIALSGYVGYKRVNLPDYRIW